MFSVASAYSWPIHQLDINNAFLHGYLDEAVYMTPPEGYEAPSGMVCKLKRSLYVLKQASRQWNLDFTTQLTAYGFRGSANDHCLFTLAHDFLALLVYVDNVLITGTSDTLIQNVKSYLDRMPRLVLLHCLLVLNLVRMKGLFYRSLIGIGDSFGNFCTFVSPDRTFPSRYNNLINSCNIPHNNIGMHHSCGSLSEGFIFHSSIFPSQNSLQLSAFLDVDWAACVDSRRSVKGY
ncbi:UNVERIFIED_CONTAM: Retrovirus-related Pol polyprotein from transposon RE1 [Sesamum angustifolium]|uniref:Retrovirus-related Pol polyprotein from transposon RE1 n=1 Tax=Sesamum angustifolium TaxID=2727405 RepID=A0AAW2II34_9LAMI